MEVARVTWTRNYELHMNFFREITDFFFQNKRLTLIRCTKLAWNHEITETRIRSKKSMDLLLVLITPWLDIVFDLAGCNWFGWKSYFNEESKAKTRSYFLCFHFFKTMVNIYITLKNNQLTGSRNLVLVHWFSFSVIYGKFCPLNVS